MGGLCCNPSAQQTLEQQKHPKQGVDRKADIGKSGLVYSVDKLRGVVYNLKKERDRLNSIKDRVDEFHNIIKKDTNSQTVSFSIFLKILQEDIRQEVKNLESSISAIAGEEEKLC